MLIRLEEECDWDAVHALNYAAFDSPAEAELVVVLREVATPVVSMVAECDGEVCGHIMFSPVKLRGREDLAMMGLGPMAVLPALQRQGVGTALVRAGLERCGKVCVDGGEVGAVVVLGHPEYYPRFGFRPSVEFDIRSEYEVPDEVFMCVELADGYLQGATGVVAYHEAFGSV